MGFLNNFWNSFRIFWYLWDEKAAYISHQNYPKRKFDGIIWLHNQHISPFSLLEGHMTWLCQPSNYLKRKFDPIIWLCKQPISPFSLLRSHVTCLYKPSKFPFLESHQPKYWILLNFPDFIGFLVFLELKKCLHKPSKFPFLEIPSQNRSHDLLMSAIKIGFFGNSWA